MIGTDMKEFPEARRSEERDLRKAAARTPGADGFCHRRVVPFDVRGRNTARSIVERLERTSTEARNLGAAVRVWEGALAHRTTIFLGVSGAAISSGMRLVLAYIIENRLVDCVVATGANLFDDVHETLGRYHYRGAPGVNDATLAASGVDRVFDTLAVRDEHREDLVFVARVAAAHQGERMSTRTFLFHLGEGLAQASKQRGILASAYRAEVPVYCAGFAASPLGGALGSDVVPGAEKLEIDVLEDVREAVRIVTSSEGTAAVSVGGGAPESFIHQATEAAILMGYRDVERHRYVLRFDPDAPDGGAPTPVAADEPGDSDDPRHITVPGDPMISVPLITSVLAEGRARRLRKFIPQFKMLGDFKVIE